MNKNKLEGRFCRVNELAETLVFIKEAYSLPEKKIFEFTCVGKDELLLVYNILNDEFISSKEKGSSIILHKKGNCLYSLNSINLIVSQTGQYTIDWDKYQNCLLTTQHSQLAITKTELNKIHYI